MTDAYKIPPKYAVPGTKLQLQIDPQRNEVVLHDTENPERFGKGPMGIKALPVDSAEITDIAIALADGKVPEGLVDKIENEGYSDRLDMGGA